MDERHADTADLGGGSCRFQGSWRLIATPLVHRFPVVTRVTPLSDAVIIAAVLREQRRQGQSFLICPRIQNLDPMLARVQAAAPDLRIVCLHGRLPDGRTEKTSLHPGLLERTAVLQHAKAQPGMIAIAGASQIAVAAPGRAVGLQERQMPRSLRSQRRPRLVPLHVRRRPAPVNTSSR